MKKRTSSPFCIKHTPFETALYAQSDAMCLASHPELIKPLFEQYQLGTYLMIFDYFTRDEEADIYHGRQHAYATALNCYEGALYSDCSDKEIRTLLVAGLFHDAGHSLGVTSDSYNISRAKSILRELHRNMLRPEKLKPQELLLSLRAIANSQWPYTSQPLTELVSKILRDADHMTAYLPDEVAVPLYKGLRCETNVLREKDLSLEVFAQMQLSFANAIQWETRWARNKALSLNWIQRNKELCQTLVSPKVPLSVVSAEEKPAFQCA